MNELGDISLGDFMMNLEETESSQEENHENKGYEDA